MKTRKFLFRILNILVVIAMTLGSPMSALAAVWTDQTDYTPGSIVTISGDNSDGAGYQPGETVRVEVLGPNSYASACEGLADAAGAWNCQVTLWAGPEAVGSYSYTATGLQSLVSQSGVFTDSNGDFSLDFVAAAPYSYNHLTGGGAYDDRTVGTTNGDIVESLEGGDFACGDVVTYLIAVKVDDTDQAAVDAPQTIEMDFSFLADTTGQSGAALGDIVSVGVNYGTIQDLVAGENTVDDGISDDGGSTATLINEHMDGTIFVDGVLNGTVVLTDLERNEQVVVRIDVKLFCQPGSDPTGNLQADLQAVRLTYINGTTPVTPPAAIPGGAQTVPFKQIGDMVAPAIAVQKTVTTADGACPGGETLTIFAGETVKYCYVVTNPSNTMDPPGAPLYNVTLVDDNGTPANTADDFPVTLTGLTDEDMDGTADDLAAGGSAAGFALVTLSTVGTVVNTATAVGYDAIVYPTPYTDTDTASVTVQPPPVVAPMPRVIKGNAEGNDNVATLNEPGGSVTINVVVYNDAPAGTGDAVLASLTDDIYGDITTTGHHGITATTCATGGTIAGGSSYACSFTVDISSEPATILDTLAAVLQNTHSSVSDSDQANVTILNVMPTVNLVKDVTPATLAEPGGAFNYTLTIYNTSDEAVTITALTDDNPLPAGCAGLIGQTIPAGGSLSCSYSVTHTEPGSYPNTASVTVQDNEGSPASDSDSETVTVTNEMPVVDLVKDVTPATLAEPGGVFHYTLTITNHSVENVTITALTDDNPLPVACTDLIGDVLTPGQSVTCGYDVTHTEPGSYPNTASVTVQDNEGSTAGDSDSETVSVTNVMPVVDLTKAVTPATLAEPGGVFHYTLTITNNSVENVTITALTDSNLLSTACMDLVGDVLTPGQSVSCTYDVPETEAGAYSNTASVTVEDNEGNPASDIDTQIITVTDVLPTVDLTKTAAPAALAEPGGVFTFTLTIHNTSAEAVTITALTDDNPLSAQCQALIGTSIAAGASVSCTYPVTHTEAGSYPNTASVTVKDNENNPASDSDNETVTVTNVAPSIAVDKTASPTSLPEPGGMVTFTVVVTNNSIEPVTLTSLTDDVYGSLNGQGTCVTGGTIAVGASYTCSFQGSVSGEPGSYTDVVTAVATDNEGTTDSDFDDATVILTDVAPDISVTKTANPTSVPETGGDVTFTFVVTNHSFESVTLTSLTDSVFGNLNGQGTCATGGTIAAGASYSCQITKFLSSDSLTPHTNVVTAVAADNDGTTDTATDDETVTFIGLPPLVQITKTASPTHVPETGANVTFTFLVENIGVEDFTLTALSDTVFGDLNGKGTCVVPQNILIGGSYSCTYTVFLASDTLTAHTNVATASVVDDDGATDTDDDDATVTFDDVAPLIRTTKTASPTHVPETGGNVTFTFLVENIGQEDVTLTTLSDTVFGSLDGKGTCDVPQILLIGGSYSCTYTVFLASDTLTDHINVVTATAVDDDGTQATDDDDATVTFDDIKPDIAITKTANPTHVPETGGSVTFTFVVTNNGVEAVTLTSLTDTVFGDLNGQGTCATGGLIPVGGSYSCSITEFLAADDLVAHTNVVTASVVDNDGATDTDDDDATVTFDDVAPLIRTTKTASPTHVPETGGNVTFTFLVENIGQEDVTLTTLSDTVFGSLDGKGTCVVPQNILIGGSYSCTYTVFLASDTLTDHINVVTATAVDDDGTGATDDDDATVTFENVLPSIEVTKTANPTAVPETGGDVTFTFVVKNTSTKEAVTITSLADSIYGALTGDADCKVGTVLAAGASCEFTLDTWVEGDYSGPDHVNVFTAKAIDNDNSEATDNDDAAVDFTNVLPSIEVTKTANPTTVLETGGNVTFTFVVQNTSIIESVTITSLSDSVYGALAGDADCKVGTILAAGASCEFAITKWVEGDYSGPDHVNVFTAKAVDNDNSEAADSDDAAVDFTNVLPSIEVTKTANPTAVPETGGDVVFTFVVKNTSTEEAVTITSLVDSVYGTLAGDADCKVGTVLASSASCEFTITKWVEGDYSGPDHINVFTAKAVDNDNSEATDSDDAAVDFTNVLPSIEVTKTANPTAVAEPGGNVTFTFVVQNTSIIESVTITSLSDSVYGVLAGDADCKVGTILAAGASCEFTITKWVAGDYSGPDHINVFTAKAVDNDNSEAADSDNAAVDFTDVLPDITVAKTASPASVPEPGGDVTFTFKVTNSGTEAVTITSLVDSVYGTLVGDADCKIGTVLAAGASCEFSFVKKVSGNADDTHINVFTAAAEDDDGNSDEASDNAVVTIQDVLPSILVDKTPSKTRVIFLGEVVTFKVRVTNTSVEPVYLTSLIDDKFGNLDKDTLQPHTWMTSTCDVPLYLAVGGSYNCEFTAKISTTLEPFKSYYHINTVTGTAFDDDDNVATDIGTAIVKFYWRGRTPGYWKNHAKEWPKFSIVNHKGETIAITTSTPVLSVFNLPLSLQKCVGTSCILDLDQDGRNDTLFQALSYKGKDDLAGKAQILLRAAVAALLNERHFGVAYPPYASVTALINAVNTTLATLDGMAYINLANQLDWWNNGVP